MSYVNDLKMSRIEPRSNNFEMKGFCSLTLLMMFCSVEWFVVALYIFDVNNLSLSYNTS